MTVSGDRLQRELERALYVLRHGDEIEARRIALAALGQDGTGREPSGAATAAGTAGNGQREAL